nr:unnamed protein product [Leishmania braziliensis]
MEQKKPIAATARTKTPSVNSGVSVLQSLQRENDTLRSELLRSKQHKTQLQRQLNELRTVTEQIVREVTMSSKEQVRALEERCRLLADRLVASKREEQVTETARVGFLLRSQIEERQFLRRGLEAMQEVLVGVGDSAASGFRNGQLSVSASTRPADEGRDGEVHTGDLYRLMMTVSDALHAHTASAKLEKARTRLTLEQAASLLDELRDAVEDATRAAFDAAVQTSVVCDAGTTLAAGGDAFQLSSMLMAPRGTPAATAQNASGFADTTSFLHRQGAGASPFAYSAMAPSPSAQLSLELEWVCDVLKACMKGATEVRVLLGAAAEGLKAPPLQQRRRVAGDRSSATEQVPPLELTASPEMNALLCSFLEDLSTIKERAARQQEDMARQLAHEVERHFQSTQQYEERVKLLEAECARLLFYMEKQATQSPRVDATTPTPARQHAAVSAMLMPSLVPVQDTHITPERCIATRGVAKLSERRPARPPRKTSAETSRVLLADQRTPPQVSRSARPMEAQDAALSTSAGHAIKVDKPAHANRDTSPHYFLQEFSLDRPYSASEQSRATVPIAPSPTASTIWSAYRDRKARLQHLTSEALRSPPGLHSPLLSPAPPAVHPKTLTTTTSSSTAFAHSLSPQRRSTTVSTPPRQQGTATFRTGTPTPVLSSVFSTPKRSSVHPNNAADGSVSPHNLTRAAAAPLSSAEPPLAITTAAGPRDPTPPLSGTPVTTSRQGHKTSRHRTHLPPQLYDEAAADFFSFHSTSLGAVPSTLSSMQRLRLGSSQMSDFGGTAEMRTQSPWRLVQPTSNSNRASPGESTVLRTGRQLHTPPGPVSGVLLGHASRGGGAVDTLGQAETPGTPPIWRRIKEEASFQPHHSPSPIAGGDASSLFGTPCEVPWANV